MSKVRQYISIRGDSLRLVESVSNIASARRDQTSNTLILRGDGPWFPELRGQSWAALCDERQPDDIELSDLTPIRGVVAHLKGGRPMMPDPRERKFFLVRLDISTDRSVSKEAAIHPHTGAEIDPQDASTWMTYDNAKALADAWGLQFPMPSVTFAVKAALSAPVPSAPAVPVSPTPAPSIPLARVRRPVIPGAHPMLPPELAEIRQGKSGELIPDEENIGIILERDPALQGIVRYNEFSGELTLVRPITADPSVVGESGLPRPWIDEDTIVLQRFIQRYIIPKVGRDRIEAVVAQHAKYHCAFHPIRDYLQSLSWDGTPRLHTWLQTYFGAGKQPAEYLGAIGAAWLISGVARIFEPGCKADNALVLEGAQGTYKSTALRMLAGNSYFSDSLSADLSHKDARDHLRGKWIIELAELSQFKRSEIETVKAFITRQVEQYRPSYGRHEISFPRQCIFAGSTNDETYLVDRTGNRRWWSVSCTRVDLNGLVRDRDQLWAEAVHRYRANEPWWLSKDIEALAAAEASLRVAHDPWTAHVVEVTQGLAGPDVSPGEVMTRMNLPTTERHDRNAGRVGQILRDLGWERGKRHKTRGQLYVRPMPAIPPPPVSAA